MQHQHIILSVKKFQVQWEHSSLPSIVKKKLDKGGEVYDYEELKARFEKSDFGDNDHGHHHHHNRADAHAPIGVMGDHLHPKGGLMISYRHMNMFMDGNRDGSNLIDDSEVYNDYMVAPQEMGM